MQTKVQPKAPPKVSTIKIIIIVLLCVITFIAVFTAVTMLLRQDSTPAFSNSDLAMYLSQNGVKIYGAFWCEPCETQKQLFGEGWEYVNYVDCGVQGETGTFNEECVQAGITGIPIWELKNGTRIPGMLTTYQLALLTGYRGKSDNPPGNGLAFTGPPPLTATLNQPFTFSLCQPPPTPIDATCGGLRPATNPTGGKPPYSMSVKLGGGFLPPGIALNLDGWLTGTPTKEGTYNFRVCARDGFGEEGCTAVTINVQPEQTPTAGPETWSGTGTATIAHELSADLCYGKSATATYTLTINSPHSLVAALRGEKEITLWSDPNYEATSGTVSGTVEVTAQPPRVSDNYYCVISGGSSPVYQITFFAVSDGATSRISISNADAANSMKAIGKATEYEKGNIQSEWELAYFPSTWTVTSISDTTISGTIEPSYLDKGTFTLTKS